VRETDDVVLVVASLDNHSESSRVGDTREGRVEVDLVEAQVLNTISVLVVQCRALCIAHRQPIVASSSERSHQVGASMP
jgi:hypothetical protein